MFIPCILINQAIDERLVLEEFNQIFMVANIRNNYFQTRFFRLFLYLF